MKKFLFPLIILMSCQKNLDILPDLTSDAKREFSVSDIVQPYQDRMFNTCLNEYILLTGSSRYSIKESFINGFYLDYIIEVDALGIGEISGMEFKGGGKSVGRVRINDSGDVKGKILYDIKYVSPGGNHMGYLQHANFILKNQEVKVEFNNETPTCE